MFILSFFFNLLSIKPMWFTCSAASLALELVRWSLHDSVRFLRSTTTSRPHFQPAQKTNIKKKKQIIKLFFLLFHKRVGKAYLELHSDLKCLVGVLQGFKGHVRVAIEPGKLHLHHCKWTKGRCQGCQGPIFWMCQSQTEDLSPSEQVFPRHPRLQWQREPPPS